MRLALLTFGLSSAALLSACGPDCNADADCNDGTYCNGVEACVFGRCTKPGGPNCDDGLACTHDFCNENTQSCRHEPPDVDNDGYGDITCLDPIGVPLGNDCDDHDANRSPGNREVCDAHVDEDCDPESLGNVDEDHDGYISSACGNDLADGGIVHGLDCDDSNEGVHPGQLESCNGMDDNCNGSVDEGVKVSRFADNDGDGYGTGASVSVCADAPFTSAFDNDCDDTNPAMHPGEFKCVVGGQGTEYQLCGLDGGFSMGVCGGKCLAQPNGTGICGP